ARGALFAQIWIKPLRSGAAGARGDARTRGETPRPRPSGKRVCGGGADLRGPALALALALGLGGGKEGAAPDALVKGRPPLTGGEALLQPVEAAQAPPEVVDHVDQRGLAGAGHNRTSVLKAAVVAED